MDFYRASNSRVRGALWKALYVQDGIFRLSGVRFQLQLEMNKQNFFKILKQLYSLYHHYLHAKKTLPFTCPFPRNQNITEATRHL
jgi:hypothetical protein